ncbi:MAG TPA: formimidoylglutamate deiminase [Jatrophihabitans sp.]|jgi:formiminoglutamate deiminase|uniref:formimidoylglutamate deiminase n=1 Tax=Jatrophihabitans sp. TaxID=1932789 RepID=UPI002EEF754F
MSSYWAPYGWLPGGVAEQVRLVAEAGRWVRVEAGVAPAGQDVRLPGLVLPGFANTHSHAFHRALRGRTHGDGGTFWTWRDRMYALARRLEPESYHLLARAVYAEMALAGISAVGEFHYLHHQRDGSRYPDPNAFGHALLQAAAEAGIRITLLDTCYLSGGLGPAGHLELDEVQRRFSDGSATGWRQRVALLARAETDRARVGAAIHSVRAVPAGQLADVVTASAGRPLHAHVSEQPAENEATQAHYGCSPSQLLAAHGFGGPLHTAVHATHLSAEDIALHGRAGTNISFCPTTERDLADGIGPAPELAAAGARLTLGSDQNACVDLLEEARALELDARLASLRRGRFTPAELVEAMTGHASLGWSDAGRLAPGQRADLVALRLDTVRTAGALPEQVTLVAGAADVDTVLVDGRLVVSGGRHVLGDVAGLLAEAIAPLWR